MLQTGERAQLIAAARLYYEDNFTQAQVAQRLGVSRPSVSKMLARALATGFFTHLLLDEQQARQLL